MPFHAHEVLEEAWKSAPEPERALWRALAQLAVGLTHAGRGNATGASALLRRGAAGIEPYGQRPPHGVDVAGLRRWADQLVEQLAHHTGPLAVDAVAPHLLGGPPSARESP
jgi:predicted metal-dependent hydrolase